ECFANERPSTQFFRERAAAEQKANAAIEAAKRDATKAARRWWKLCKRRGDATLRAAIAEG
ncbi:MAG: hypothetical protein J2P55_08805, partial [Rhizobiales bacterium]|nr:hypothetical protein [Hyphomicrobiales bacterium]